MKNENLEAALQTPPPSKPSGVLLINKPKGSTSFRLVSLLRRLCDVQKIGHAGTLDPFATGVMILLVGKDFTKLSDRFLTQDKEYIATLRLGIRTDSYDCEGEVVSQSDLPISEELVQQTLSKFQGSILQTPPMFSAKKVNGKKLYELARKGITIPRAQVPVTVNIQYLTYEYPFLTINVSCSMGTYIRSLAEDIGLALGCGAHLSELTRTRSGSFHLADCFDGTLLTDPKSLEKLRFIPVNQLDITQN